MSSKSPEPRSISSQLVLLFTLSAAFLLCCGLGVLYWIFVRHAYEEDNEVLADKVLALQRGPEQGERSENHERRSEDPSCRESTWLTGCGLLIPEA